MRLLYNIGDLVHIPQAVKLVEYGDEPGKSSQLTIPLRIRETSHPEVGIVTRMLPPGYVRIYCNGEYWHVREDKIYSLQGGAFE